MGEKTKKPLGILINDIHLDKDNGELVKYIFSQLKDACKKYGVKTVFCGGDVFTNRSGQPLGCLITWKEILHDLGKNKITLHVIPGNHDKTDSESEKSYLDVYSDTSMVLHRGGDYVWFYDDCVIGFVPFFTDEKWKDEYEKMNADLDMELRDRTGVKRFLITHMGFDGVKNNDGSAVTSELKPGIFSSWNKVFVGHYHNASKIGKNVYYTGSAYQNNYGERYDDKGFMLIYTDGSTRFIPTSFPRYIKITLPANDPESLREAIENWRDDDSDFIRFVFRGKKTDCANINISELSDLGIDVKFEVEETAEAIETAESDAVLLYDTKSIKKDFIRFCSENEIRGEKLKYGLELMKLCGIQSK